MAQWRSIFIKKFKSSKFLVKTENFFAYLRRAYFCYFAIAQKNSTYICPKNCCVQKLRSTNKEYFLVILWFWSKFLLYLIIIISNTPSSLPLPATPSSHLHRYCYVKMTHIMAGAIGSIQISKAPFLYTRKRRLRTYPWSSGCEIWHNYGVEYADYQIHFC